MPASADTWRSSPRNTGYHYLMRISIVTVNWNGLEVIPEYLDSLSAQTTAPHEVVVVDNGSTDGSEQLPDLAGAKVISLPENRGFAVANNIGMRAARGRYFLILNSDTEILADALERICDYLDANPDVGALGPQLLNTDRTLQYSCRRFPSFRTALFHRYSIMTKLFPRNRFSSQYLMTDVGHDHTMDVDWVSGAALVVRREVFEQSGGFDEGFFMYAEDVDWCYRIKQAGWRIVYLPEAQILHHIGKSTRLVPYAMIYQRHRSMWRFYRKHYSRGIVLVDVATFCGIALRCGLMISRAWLLAHLTRRSKA